MKKIFLGLFLTASFAAQGATVSTVFTNSNTNAVITGYLSISSITLANNTTTDAANITLYDAPTNSLTYTLSAYTNNTTSSVITNKVRWTNYFGAYQTNSFLMVTNTTATVAASTNLYPTLLTTTVPAGTTQTYTYTDGLEALRGVLATANTNATITINYRRR